MTTPRRFAALAVCLLALAAGASAACVAGSFEMELVGYSSGAASHDIAKCLSSVKVSLDLNCKVSLAAGASDNSYVKSIWGNDNSLYPQLQLCPAASTTAAYKTDTKTSIVLAFDAYIYGLNTAGDTANKPSGVSAIAYTANGVVTLTVTGSSAGTLTYAIRAVTNGDFENDVDSAVVVTDGTGLTLATHYKADVADPDSDPETDDSVYLGDACGAGRYALLITDTIKLCPLCPAGTHGDGNGCMACAAGKASGSVGVATPANLADACTECGSGLFAQQGSTDCLPCPMHTYSAGGVGECTPCDDDYYAWIPGSSECLRCVNGVPKVKTDNNNNPGAASPGNHILTISSQLTCTASAASGDYRIPVYETCSWNTASASLQLSLYVAGDCSITIKPISDKTCSDPGANATALALQPRTGTNAANGLDVDGKYLYNYNDLVIHAYYSTKTAIRTLLPSTNGGASSFMLNIDYEAPADPVNDDDNLVALMFYRATNKPGDAAVLETGGADAAKKCTVASVPVAGGTVAGTTDVAATCPAGTYSVNNEYCHPCPQGSICASGSATPCDASYGNPYLGLTTGACVSCSPATSGYTSVKGDAYCTVPWFDRMCATGDAALGGYEWDESANACVKCRPGTYRTQAMLTNGPADCQECDAGQYSIEGATQCEDCPAGQYNPSKGLGDQTAITGKKCLLCPVGSIALLEGGSAGDYTSFTGTALPPKATICDACPSGTWADIAVTVNAATPKGCTLCASGYYRSGDAAQNNNACKKIPAGFKAKDTKFVDTTGKTGAYEIDYCAKGTVSFWTVDDRTPDTAPDACEPCTGNTYAPRTGMAACLSCKGGTEGEISVDENDDPLYLGQDYCKTCDAGTFRSFYNTDNFCSACGVGKESGPSNRQACTLCRPGSYKNVAANDFCSECPVNTYMPKPGASAAVGAANGCIWCPKGYETQDAGNTECTKCPLGYYNPKAASTSASPACIKAPAGTFVNITGAFITTSCPVGYYNNQEGQDSCEPCAPGAYAGTTGSKTCKTCPAGTYSSGAATTCKACAAGYYAPAGSGSCSPCKPGTYSSSARSGTCSLCPKGFQCPTPATSAPKACPAGTFTSKDGAALCTPCPVNTFSVGTGNKQCQACAKGTNTRGLTGQKACQTVRATSLRRSVL